MSIKSLKRQASGSARHRGHKLSHWNGDEQRLFAECRHCGAEVAIITNPLPNEIDIGGEAVAINCPKKGCEGGEG